jgi:ferredoxin-NADP reductase
MGWFKGLVQKLELVGQNYYILTVERPPSFQFEAGQYVTFQLGDEGDSFNRSYSIASSPRLKDSLEFCIQASRDGKGASYFKTLKVGDSLLLSPPSGKFQMVDTHRHLVFVAGGSGIGPIRSFLKSVLDQPSALSKVDLLYGSREATSFPFKNEFEYLSRQFPDRLNVTLLAENGEANGVLPGNPVQALQRMPHLVHSSIHYYLCGPPSMIQALKQILLSQSVDEGQIFVEDYG